MFDWLKGKDGGSNIVQFPEKTTAPPIPKEEPTKIFYRIGVADNNRLTLQLGYSEITMSKLGVKNLIEQLQTFLNQMPDEEKDDNS